MRVRDAWLRRAGLFWGEGKEEGWWRVLLFEVSDASAVARSATHNH